MLPEEIELTRLESEQGELEEQVVQTELALETCKAETAQFQHRYYRVVGRLYAQLDELDAQIAVLQVSLHPADATVQAYARAAERQARRSAEEAGLIESQPAPPQELTAELKLVYRRAARLMHPDRAVTEAERQRRTDLMAQVNRAYENGDQRTIERMIDAYGQDPEAIAGDDIGSRIVKAIRRIAQLRRRLGEAQHELAEQQQSELFQLRQSVEDGEALGGDPLGELAQQLVRELSERRARLEMLQHL
ncbi:MAG TPA: J domain-containing protein [Gallionella sp.]|nr:J domain-containing protein [Gallionella sp.]